MRAEDVVGLSFFLGVFVGFGLMLYGTTRPQGSRERARWQGVGLLVEALAFVAFGLITSYLIRSSPRVVVEGNIWDVREPMRGPASFRVTDASGRAALIRCRYDGPGLREGERARIRYVEYNRKLLALTMLTGPYTGWELEESPGELSFLPFAAVGLLCGLASYRLSAAHRSVQKK